MSEPIVFISHHQIKDGRLEDLRSYFQEGTPRLKVEKSGTVAFLAYTSADGRELGILHIFPDAKSMDDHLQGVDERAKGAYEVIQPIRYEIYGKPSAEAWEMLEQEAAQSGVVMETTSDYLGGFLRLMAG